MARKLLNLIDGLSDDWKNILIKKELLDDIQDKLNNDLDLYEGLDVYPIPDNTFRAFQYCNLNEIKVVIIGQDCYHQPNQAIGLCFGVPDGIKIPPSLRNIKKEIETDINREFINYELVDWAKQGVLLLNSALTVRQSCAGSHLPFWKKYTDNIIGDISNNTLNIVFLLWGKYAQAKEKLINIDNGHLILKANHPSPLSANRGGWFGNKHFTITNNYLEEHGKSKINW